MNNQKQAGEQLNFVLNDEKRQTKVQSHLAFIKGMTTKAATLTFKKGTINYKAVKWAYFVAKGIVIAPHLSQFRWESGARKSVVTVENGHTHITVNIKAA